MEKKRLIILSHMFPNNMDTHSGIFIFEQVKALAALGKYDISVISPVPYSPRILWFRKKWRDYGRIRRGERIGKLGDIGDIGDTGDTGDIEVLYPRYLCLPGKHWFFLQGITMFISILPLICRMTGKNGQAVIHSHTVLPDGLAAALLKKFHRRVKTVCSARGSDIHIYPYRNRAAMYLTGYSLKSNDAITAVSADLKNKCLSFCENSGKRVDVVYNGLREDWFTKTEEEQKEIENLKGQFRYKTNLLFVGELSKEKGTHELIRSFARIAERHRDAGLFVVGGGVERDALERLCAENHIRDQVVFTGPVRHEQVKIYMNLCDILILPSYSEGMPNVMLEAMALRTPVIVTKVGGVEEILADRFNGMLIEPGSVRELIGAVERLLYDGKLYDSISSHAYQLARSSFSWDKNARKMDSIYEEILRG